jgi:SAM-dependent methyltransferase
MHDTAYEIGRRFLEIYGKPSSTIVEIGALDVNGTLRDFCPQGARYCGLDLACGPGVDVVTAADASLPLRSRCADLVLASSAFEHDAFFWETFLELARILKSGGLLYLNVPSNGEYHRYPADNWRFYPDSGKALERWAEKRGYRLSLVESFVAERKGDKWNDFVAVFAKEAKPAPADVTFMSADVACANVWRIGATEPLEQRTLSQDMVLIEELRRDLARQQADAARLQAESARLRAESARLQGLIRTLEARPLHRLSAMLERLGWFGNNESR